MLLSSILSIFVSSRVEGSLCGGLIGILRLEGSLWGGPIGILRVGFVGIFAEKNKSRISLILSLFLGLYTRQPI